MSNKERWWEEAGRQHGPTHLRACSGQSHVACFCHLCWVPRSPSVFSVAWSWGPERLHGGALLPQ